MNKNIFIPDNYTAALIMADGDIYWGKAIGFTKNTFGEICFNTSITGYQEVLSDLSYSGQIITFTFPHIGNIGTNSEDIESFFPSAKGLVIRNDITNPSNFRNNLHFNEWLKQKELSGICGIDTRALTRKIRKSGPQNVAIIHFDKESELNLDSIKEELNATPQMEGLELASKVTCKNKNGWGEGVWQLKTSYNKTKETSLHIVALDFGAKLNILRCLSELSCKITVVPAKTSANDILDLKPDGIFLSNGPGDPAETARYALETLNILIDSNIPIFGICLGHQLLSIALGCKTIKMSQGHRGANHPVQNLSTKQVEITSQNHGFVVDKNSLPDDIEITHLSLFDGSIEGIKSKSKPIFSVQHHPESSPGPHDSFYLFEQFIGLIKKNNDKKS